MHAGRHCAPGSRYGFAIGLPRHRPLETNAAIETGRLAHVQNRIHRKPRLLVDDREATSTRPDFTISFDIFPPFPVIATNRNSFKQMVRFSAP